MKLSLTRSDLVAIMSATGSVVKAGQQKEKDMKPHSTDFKVLAANKSVLEKAEYASGIIEKEQRIVQDLDLNRAEAKVLAVTLLQTKQIQIKILAEYAKRPDNHQSFKDEEGRRKKDYVSRLESRMIEVDNVLNKIRLAL